MTPHLRKILVKFRESLPHPLKLKRELIVGLAKPGEAELRKRHREQRRRRQHAKLSDGNKQQQHRSSFETSILFGKCCSTQYQTFIIQILNWNVNQKLEWNMVTKNLNLANWLFLLPISTFKSNKEVLGLALGFDLRLLSMNSWNVENTNCQFKKLDSDSVPDFPGSPPDSFGIQYSLSA